MRTKKEKVNWNERAKMGFVGTAVLETRGMEPKGGRTNLELSGHRSVRRVDCRGPRKTIGLSSGTTEAGGRSGG